MQRDTLRSAAKWTSAAAAVRALVQVAQLVLVARLFSGHDLGVLILLFSIIAVAQLFADVGISNLLMHHQQVTVQELRGIRGMALGMGLVLCGGLLLAAPLLARFYADARLHGLVSLAGVLFLLNSVWQPKRALLEKVFDFRVVGSGEIVAALVSQAAMVLAVLQTGSVYAVLVAPLGNSLLMGLWLLLARRDGEDLRFAFSRAVLRRFGGYSAYTLGFNLTNSVSVYADIFIGGRVLGAAALGGHGIAKDLSLKIGWIINPIVTRISTPLMAQLQQERERLRQVYTQVLRVTTALNFPIFASLVLFSGSYTALVFGASVVPYQPSFVLLGLWGLLRSVGNPSGSLFFALGKTHLAFYFSLGSMLLFAASASIGVQHGVVGLAVAMLLSMALQQVFAIWFFIVRPLTGMAYGEYLGSLLPASAAAAISFGGISLLVGAPGTWPALIASQLAAGLAYLALLGLFDRPMARQALQLLQRR